MRCIGLQHFGLKPEGKSPVRKPRLRQEKVRCLLKRRHRIVLSWTGSGLGGFMKTSINLKVAQNMWNILTGISKINFLKEFSQ